MTQGLAPSTRRSYASSQAQFISFCHQLGKLHPSGLPCPADEWTLCLFVTFLARTIKHSSIKVYLSGVRALHIDHGFPDPLINCLRLQRVVRGIKRCQGSSSSSRLPITDDLMLVIWQSSRITACFGQLVPLDILAFFVLRSLPFPICLASRRHSTWVSRIFQWIHPQLHPACASGSRARRLIHLGRAVSFTLALGRHPLCAVCAVMNYPALRGDAPGPLFLLQSGQPLSRNILTDWLRQIMASARVPGKFSSHSFRIGAATVAARNGVPDHLIQSMGRWSSNAYQLYIRTPAEALAALSIKLA